MRWISDGGWRGWGRRRRSEAFCGNMSRSKARGHNPVWFHFKHGGRGTWPVKLMRRVQHVLAHAIGPSIFQLAHCVCVFQRTCWPDFSPPGWVLQQIDTESGAVCKTHVRGADLLPLGYLSSPGYLWHTINAGRTHLHVWPTSHLGRLHMATMCFQPLIISLFC